jgi:hypothetical protein
VETARACAIIVEVPEAEPVVASHRTRLDSHARFGVPAHVTLLFPFAPPALIGEDRMRRIGEVVASVPWFDYQLIRTDWFDTQVLWLAPDDSRPFLSLTARLSAAFPDWPPYGGQFDQVVPHLTVADHHALVDMQAAERAVQPHLPIRAVARNVSLFAEHESGRWARAGTFALGGCALAEAQRGVLARAAIPSV